MLTAGANGPALYIGTMPSDIYTAGPGMYATKHTVKSSAING